MPLPIHDRLASTANMAKALLMTLDSRNIETPVQTEQLRLILETLVGMARQGSQELETSARKTVAGTMVAMTEAHRTEADMQAQRSAEMY